MVDMPADAVNELRSLFLFERLSEEQLSSLCQLGRIEEHQPGVVFREGEPAARFYVLLDGTISLGRRVGAQEVETVRTAHRGAYAGAWSAGPGTTTDPYQVTLRAVSSVRLFSLASSDFGALISQWFPMALHLLDGVFYGNRDAQRQVGERERLLALGSLTAGLTHELNNPAAAAVRATAALRTTLADLRRQMMLFSTSLDDQQAKALLELASWTLGQRQAPSGLGPVEIWDLEGELATWVEDHEVPESDAVVSVLVRSGFHVGWLDHVLAVVGRDVLGDVVRWLTCVIESENLIDEIGESTGRISTLVEAAKQYSQMDRGPYQVLDVHELLDSTLVMLSGRVGGVQVSRDYDRSLPKLPVYGAELNQVWTNLIDNALQAMDGAGTLTLRTSLVGDHVQVEIGDTGPGIPAEVIDRIFEPFFSTKPVGRGTGLGLDISWRIVVNRHQGQVSVTSVPGDTRFQIRLPVHAPDVPVQ